nr:hypothetical protein BDOA9_0133810 [Bradyrhizobium sp. DOA9]
MLQCERSHAAMQTSGWTVASGIHKLSFDMRQQDCLFSRKGFPMSKIASVALAPSSSLFARLLAALDGLLMASAEISNRNGDLPRFGL